MTQNARQLPSRSTDGTVLDLATAFDANGNVASVTDYTSNAQQSRTLGYDGLDRLTGASSPMFGTVAYRYDTADNLTRVWIDGGNLPRNHTYCYNTTTNRLDFVRTGPDCASSGAAITLAYDVQGNLSGKNSTTYVFDYGNRLRSTAGLTYRYDADGRRVRQDSSGSQLKYSYYAKDGRLVWQRDEPVGKRINNVYFAGSLLSEISRPIGTDTVTFSYFHTDALGSPIAKTNSAGISIETSEYEPYGKLVNRANDDRAGYTGHVMDSASGLTYMQQRYYDPQIGQFLSVDPVTAYGDPVGSFNRYWYANNNPYKFTDPDGRIAYQVGNTIYIPVTFRGSGASSDLVRSVVGAANRLVTQDGTRIVVVPVNRVMGGVNVMNVSPGLTNRANSTYGEGIVKGPGVIPNSGAHIDSTRSDVVGAVLHDALHFANLSDRYTESADSAFGSRGESTPHEGFEDSIMAGTNGKMLYQEETRQFQDAYNGLHGEKEWNELQERINDD
jgi:RHS repeat-associated protein